MGRTEFLNVLNVLYDRLRKYVDVLDVKEAGFSLESRENDVQSTSTGLWGRYETDRYVNVSKLTGAEYEGRFAVVLSRLITVPITVKHI